MSGQGDFTFCEYLIPDSSMTSQTVYIRQIGDLRGRIEVLYHIKKNLVCRKIKKTFVTFIEQTFEGLRDNFS